MINNQIKFAKLITSAALLLGITLSNSHCLEQPRNPQTADTTFPPILEAQSGDTRAYFELIKGESVFCGTMRGVQARSPLSNSPSIYLSIKLPDGSYSLLSYQRPLSKKQSPLTLGTIRTTPEQIIPTPNGCAVICEADKSGNHPIYVYDCKSNPPALSTHTTETVLQTFTRDNSLYLIYSGGCHVISCETGVLSTLGLPEDVAYSIGLATAAGDGRVVLAGTRTQGHLEQPSLMSLGLDKSPTIIPLPKNVTEVTKLVSTQSTTFVLAIITTNSGNVSRAFQLDNGSNTLNQFMPHTTIHDIMPGSNPETILYLAKKINTLEFNLFTAITSLRPSILFGSYTFSAVEYTPSTGKHVICTSWVSASNDKVPELLKFGGLLTAPTSASVEDYIPYQELIANGYNTWFKEILYSGANGIVYRDDGSSVVWLVRDSRGVWHKVTLNNAPNYRCS